MTDQGNVLPNGGLIYSRDQPLDNGGPVSALSGPSVIGAGSRIVGEARFVPLNAPSQAPIQQSLYPSVGSSAGVPSPQAAHAAIINPKPSGNQQQFVPPQQRSQNPVASQVQRQAQLQQQQQQQQQQLQRGATPIPAGLPSACNHKPQDIVGAGLDDGDTINNLGGAVKNRVITCGVLVTPAMVQKRNLVFELSSQDILKHKVTQEGPRVGNLERVVVVSLEVISARNELPFQVSVNMTGCKGRDYCWNTNERALLHMPPHYHEVGTNRKLHMHAPNVSISAFRRFGRIKASQISDGIHRIPGEDFSWVHTSSPVAGVIRASYETLKPTLSNVRITENYMPIHNKFIEHIQRFLNDKISSFPGTDMRKGSITFCRTSQCNYCEPGDIKGNPRAVGFELEKPCAVYVKFLINYVILSNSVQPAECVPDADDATNPLFQSIRAAGADVARSSQHQQQAAQAPQLAGI